MKNIDKLKEVLNFLKSNYVGKDEVIDLLGIGLIARENAFILGPPGTAKSAIIRSLSNCIEDGNNFEYLLTRFTEPNELFGPFDIRKLKEGELSTNTEGMLPEASLVFLDEVFHANSAILNSLLMALNEKIFKRGKETKKIPALMFIGASNLLPEDDALNALLDRFLIRVKSDYVKPDLLEQVLIAGRKLEKNTEIKIPLIHPSNIIELQVDSKNVDLTSIRKEFLELIINFRNVGINVSDRRAVKIQNLISASAVFCNRSVANISDFWVLKYIWDTEDQIEVLSGIVETVIEKHVDNSVHPQALSNKIPDSEELIKEIKTLASELNNETISFEQQNIIKDKLRYIQTRSTWVKNFEHKEFLNKEIEELWQKMLQIV